MECFQQKLNQLTVILKVKQVTLIAIKHLEIFNISTNI